MAAGRGGDGGDEGAVAVPGSIMRDLHSIAILVLLCTSSRVRVFPMPDGLASDG